MHVHQHFVSCVAALGVPLLPACNANGTCDMHNCDTDEFLHGRASLSYISWHSHKLGSSKHNTISHGSRTDADTYVPSLSLLWVIL